MNQNPQSSTEEIKTNQTENNTEGIELPPPPPPPSSGMQSKSIFTWIIIVLIALFFLGYFLGGLTKRNQVSALQDQIETLKKEKKDLSSQISELEQAVTDLDLGIINISYENAQYGYKLSYPSNLEIIDYSNSTRENTIAFEDNNDTISIIKSGRRERPEDEYLGTAATEKLTINGQKATKHEFPEGIVREGRRTDPFIAYKIVVKGNQYILEFYGSTSLSDTQKRIFNSFEIIASSAGEEDIWGF